MARVPRNAGGADPKRKRKFDDLDRGLTAVENQGQAHADRIDSLELRFELECAYRYIRVESSPGLAEMFTGIQDGAIPTNEIRERTGQVLTREIREVLER